MSSLDKVVSRDPEIMSGSLVFWGTRVPVSTMFDYLTGGHTIADFLSDFPSVSIDQAKLVIAASSEWVQQAEAKKIA